jgi:hypothetical protein
MGVETDFTALNLPLPLRLKGSGLVEKYSVSAETIINDGFSYSKYGKCIKIRIK